jgi:excisionase family DNA binding protein
MKLSTQENAIARHRAWPDAGASGPQGDLLTVGEVAALLKVPVSWVYEHTRRRGMERMPHFKLGKYLRFCEREVFDWVDGMRRN